MTVIEVVPVEGIDLDGTPPCAVLHQQQDYTWKTCGKPSVYRVITICMACGKSLDFMCQPCLDSLKAGQCACVRHLYRRREFGGYA